MKNSVNVANNIKTIEILKAEALQNMAGLFNRMAAEPGPDTRDRLASDFAGLIAVTYLLARRLGYGYGEINENILKKLDRGIASGDTPERDFKDLSELRKYIRIAGKE